MRGDAVLTSDVLSIWFVLAQRECDAFVIFGKCILWKKYGIIYFVIQSLFFAIIKECRWCHAIARLPGYDQDVCLSMASRNSYCELSLILWEGLLNIGTVHNFFWEVFLFLVCCWWFRCHAFSPMTPSYQMKRVGIRAASCAFSALSPSLLLYSSCIRKWINIDRYGF